MSIVTKEQQEIIDNPTTGAEALKTLLSARRTISLLEKIAFWACFLRVADGIGGIVTLTIFDGAPSRDIVIATLLWVVIGVILMIRARWAWVISTILSWVVLYLTFTQPYLIQSVSNPKGPVGGIGHFFGEVFALAVEIIVCGATLGAVIQGYRPQTKRVARWIPLGLCLAIGMLLGSMYIGVMSQPSTSDSVSYTNGTPTIHISGTKFNTSSVIITKGSKLLIVDDSPIGHDLFNGSWQNGAPQVVQEPGAPLIKDVKLNESNAKIGPFTTAGTYHILCTIHQGMNLTVIVQ